jgi:hypothetical protein
MSMKRRWLELRSISLQPARYTPSKEKSRELIESSRATHAGRMHTRSELSHMLVMPSYDPVAKHLFVGSAAMHMQLPAAATTECTRDSLHSSLALSTLKTSIIPFSRFDVLPLASKIASPLLDQTNSLICARRQSLSAKPAK